MNNNWKGGIQIKLCKSKIKKRKIQNIVTNSISIKSGGSILNILNKLPLKLDRITVSFDKQKGTFSLIADRVKSYDYK